MFKPNDCVFVDDPLLRSTSGNNAEAMSIQLYKLHLRTSRQFRILMVQEKTLTIVENGIPQTESIDNIMHTPKTASTDPQHFTENQNSTSQTSEQLQDNIPMEKKSTWKYSS